MLGEKADFHYRIVRDVFLAADLDGDGRLSEADMVAVFQHFQLPADAAGELFALLLPAGNSQVEWCEFMTIFLQGLSFPLRIRLSGMCIWIGKHLSLFAASPAWRVNACAWVQALIVGGSCSEGFDHEELFKGWRIHCIASNDSALLT